MKKLTTLTALVAFLTMALSAGTMAQCCFKAGGPMQLTPAAAVTPPETLQKYKTETKALQGQLIDKQALLKKELLKDDPDPDAIGTIRKAIIDIQTDLQKVAKKFGMKNGYGSCGMFMGNGCGCGGGGSCGCGGGGGCAGGGGGCSGGGGGCGGGMGMYPWGK
jgi:predicted small lipoprotein YifL